MAGYRFDVAAARRAVSFFPDCLKHVKNSRFTKAGDPFVLEPWQEIVVMLIFGVLHIDTGLRRFKTAWIEVPRKNGKTTLAAGIGLYGLYCDNEAGAEIYCAAATKDQSSLLFDIASGMVRKCEGLATPTKIRQSVKRLIFEDSYLRAVASDAHALHGQNAHMVVADEVHAWINGGYDLWDVLETGTASRAQPLMCGITTAGFDRETKCYELHDFAGRVRDGQANDPSFLPVIFGAKNADDWESPDVWAAANPNLGKSVPIEYLAQMCQRAKDNPSFQNTFRRLHLNQWTSQQTRWLSMEAWDACYPEAAA